MYLTPEEKAMLAGDFGPGVKRAMEIIVALGKIYGAQELVPVQSVQVAGVSYKNLGDAGLEFLHEWARQGAQVRVPTTLNPAGMDLIHWREMGISEEFARKQMAVIKAFKAMGIVPSCSCTPYLTGNLPAFGQHIAWSESSAVSFANSVLGARTNREGGPSALAAAVTGRTARYGLHLDENRRATHIIDVRCTVTSEADFGALGYLVGRRVKNGVPYFKGLSKSQIALAGRQSSAPDADFSLRALNRNLLELGDRRQGIGSEGQGILKALGAAMAASGAVALYHVEGVTPVSVRSATQRKRARIGDIVAAEAETVIVDSLDEGYAALNSPIGFDTLLNSTQGEIDLVSIGCPHASLVEIEEVAHWLEGKRVKARLWITTAQEIREQAQEKGLVELIETAGGRVVADTCLVVAPIEELGLRSMATNSAKAAFYAPTHSGLMVRFGRLEQCLEAAVTGRWPG
jgi:predicted aconitase